MVNGGLLQKQNEQVQDKRGMGIWSSTLTFSLHRLAWIIKEIVWERQLQGDTISTHSS
jgi:hypothetical protein